MRYRIWNISYRPLWAEPTTFVVARRQAPAYRFLGLNPVMMPLPITEIHPRLIDLKPPV